MATGRPDDLPYLVEQWDDGDRYVEELIALTGDYRVARAAFAEAAKHRPGRIVESDIDIDLFNRNGLAPLTGVKGAVEKMLSPITPMFLWRTLCWVRTKRRR